MANVLTDHPLTERGLRVGDLEPGDMFCFRDTGSAPLNPILRFMKLDDMTTSYRFVSLYDGQVFDRNSNPAISTAPVTLITKLTIEKA